MVGVGVFEDAGEGEGVIFGDGKGVEGWGDGKGVEGWI